MASRLLSDLHPKLQPLAEEFLKRAKTAGIDVIVTCTYRSNAEQEALYEQGRTKPGHIVTRARPGQSAHNHVNAAGRPAALAFDVVPLIHGKCDWRGGDPLWQELGRIGEELGLNWYGRPGAPFREYPHFQYKGEL